MSKPSDTLPEFDLHCPAHAADPYPTFAEMRERCPAYRNVEVDWMNPATQTPIWYFTRYDDVREFLSDTERFVKDAQLAFTPEELAALPPPSGMFVILMESMINREGADHSRLRGLVNKAFTPRMVSSFADRIQAIADALIDAVHERGRMELVSDFAFMLPITVIAEMLGVPAEDHRSFREWSTAIIVPPRDADELERSNRCVEEFVAYLEDLFARRRVQPEDDLVTALLRAEDAGDRLSQRELVSMVMTLLIAGHETTVGLITNGVDILLHHPEQLALLRDDPTLIDSAVEEICRYKSSVINSTARWASRDMELHGRQIKRGDRIQFVLGAAHRDPAIFTDPDTFDIRRQDSRQHLAFGRGPHVCLGASVARLETRIGIATLLRRLPGLRHDPEGGQPEWFTRIVLHSVDRLPVRWD
ncbi:MAG: cytochrome P450 [Myxococcota bacterium]